MQTDPHIKLLFVGDIYLGEEPSVTLDGEVAKILAGADLVIVNQEGPITNCEEEVGGKGCLKSVPETAEILRGWGVDAVSLANNHMFDYGLEGFRQTRHHLDAEGLVYFGAGENLAEAVQPLVLEVRGRRIGLLAYSWSFIETTCATDSSFGCAPLDEELMIRQVRELSKVVDYVIVMPHWGCCNSNYPLPQQIKLASNLTKAGASAVVGCHSHVMQGVDVQGRVLIAYSLGNFAFANYTHNGRKSVIRGENLKGCVLKIDFAADGVASCEIDFTVLKKGRILPQNTNRRRKTFIKRSAPLVKMDYERFWKWALWCQIIRRILHWLNFFNWRNIRKKTLLSAWVMVKNALGGKKKTA